MITIEEENDLQIEFYKLNGIKNLLNAWANDSDEYKVFYISNALSESVEKIAEILKFEIN